jgi:ABC-type uncharacterized transport system substrate-binding protein
MDAQTTRQRCHSKDAKQASTHGCGCVFLLLVGLLFHVQALAADGPRILVMTEVAGGVYGQTLEGLEQVLAALPEGSRPRLVVRELSKLQPLPDTTGYELVVTLGSDMAARLMIKPPDASLLCLLIPRLTFRHLVSQLPEPSRKRVSAIYLDQPFARTLHLLQSTFPKARDIAVPLGPSSALEKTELEAVAATHGLRLHLVHIREDENPLPAILGLLDDSDVVLALPDPVVYNQYSVQGILLATYRREIPVIGFSRAYVRAGAIAAVYTTPVQVGRQAGRLLLDAFAMTPPRLPPPRPPEEYEIAVNRQVTRSLGIILPDDVDLLGQVRRMDAVQERRP